MRRWAILMLLTGIISQTACQQAIAEVPYPIVDTGQTSAFNDSRAIPLPLPGSAFDGQDACFIGRQPTYADHGDGTVTDRQTGLMWVKARGVKVTWQEAVAGAGTCRTGGYDDWRMPTIKELYSLVNFSGGFHLTAAASIPYLDARCFDFAHGDETRGERPIDCQDWSSTVYAGTTMHGAATVFGVNFADGRIKGYPRDRGPRGETNRLYVRYVRGNPQYGRNAFHDNGDGTITDRATGLTWAREDSGAGMDWVDALAWVRARNAEKYLGHDDWRLPDAKELQSLVDYTRAPAAADPARRGPAIDPLFRVTRLADGDYPFFWTGTTHLDGPPDRLGGAAVYLAFGRATGWMAFPPDFLIALYDVHGAGAQRSDPKRGDPAAFPRGRGPQGDVVRIRNFVRCVRGGDVRRAGELHQE